MKHTPYIILGLLIVSVLMACEPVTPEPRYYAAVPGAPVVGSYWEYQEFVKREEN